MLLCLPIGCLKGWIFVGSILTILISIGLLTRTYAATQWQSTQMSRKKTSSVMLIRTWPQNSSQGCMYRRSCCYWWASLDSTVNGDLSQAHSRKIRYCWDSSRLALAFLSHFSWRECSCSSWARKPFLMVLAKLPRMDGWSIWGTQLTQHNHYYAQISVLASGRAKTGSQTGQVLTIRQILVKPRFRIVLVSKTLMCQKLTSYSWRLLKRSLLVEDGA